jgi:hypothetical protein
MALRGGWTLTPGRPQRLLCSASGIGEWSSWLLLAATFAGALAVAG